MRHFIYMLVMWSFLFLVLDKSSFADQCAVINEKVAKIVSGYLRQGMKIVEYCEPCPAKGTIQVETIQTINIFESKFHPGEWLVSINNSTRDIAYVFVDIGSGKFMNLGRFSGCGAVEVSTYLPLKSLPLQLDTQAPAPTIHPIDKKTPALVPAQNSDITLKETLIENPLDSLKYGYLDIQKVLEKSSAWAKSEQELQKIRQAYQIQIDKKEKEIADLDQKIRNTPNKNDSFIIFGSITITLQRKDLENLKSKAQKEIETKKEELAAATTQELLWKIKRLGKINNYGLILSKDGLRLFEKNMLKDENNNILYRNDNIAIDKFEAKIEDFDDITNATIAFINTGETISTAQATGSASGLNTREVKEGPIKVNISVEVERELFPVMAKLILDKNFDKSGFITWTIRNESDKPEKITVTSEIPEWTQPAIKTIDIGPYETKTIGQTPFGKELLRNHSLIPSTVILNAKSGDKIIFRETKNISIRAADDMIWSYKTPYDLTFLIAAWVTPKDPVVEQILTRAKEKLYKRSLSGYMEADITPQVRAIFNAVRDVGVSYVNSLVNFGQIGFTQRVRLPRESINQRAANCIDGAVLLASLFENIGLEPLIIFVPGHAFVGVRLATGSQQTLFIETTMVGRNPMDSIVTLENTFDAAVKAGNETYVKAYYATQNNPDELRIVDIKLAREKEIYPLW
ncbi:MAG: OmpH family outer membrane protein [Nitrospirota bacterium]